jgi:hypothetical protein
VSQTFNDCSQEIVGVVDGLDIFSARKFVSRAYADICQRREWGFLRGRGVVVVPSAMSTGTVAVTKNSTDITFSAAAAAVLDIFGLNPSVAQCQIKISVAGGPYSIASYTPDGAATLELPYQEATNATATYSLVRCYVSAPDDFLRFISINDALRGKPMRFGPRWTQQTLDRIDPQRANNSEPYVFATYIPDSTGRMRYEIWPHPTVGQTFLIEYRKRGDRDDLDYSGTLPDLIGSDLILSRAKYRAYELGAARATTGVKAQMFALLMERANADYEAKLKLAMRSDKAQNPDTVVVHNERMMFPLDAEWIASHGSVPFGLDAQGW